MVLERKVGIMRSRRKRDEEQARASALDGEHKEEELVGRSDDDHEEHGDPVEEEKGPTSFSSSSSSSPSATVTSAPGPRARTLYGFSITPIRSPSGDTRTYHLLTPSLGTLHTWTRTITTTLRKARSRSGVIVHNASRSSDMPGNLTYLHNRTYEGYLFRLASASLSPLSSPQWQPRYCILSNTSLSIFLSPDHTTPSARAQGKLPLYSLSLRECVVLALPPPVTEESQGWLFELRGHRVHNHGEHHKHVFGCGSEEERRTWMSLLERAGGGGRGVGGRGRGEVSWTETGTQATEDSVGRVYGAKLPTLPGLATPSVDGLSLSAVGRVVEESKADDGEEKTDATEPSPRASLQSVSGARRTSDSALAMARLAQATASTAALDVLDTPR